MYHHNYPPNQAPGQQATGGFQPPQLANSNMAALNYPPLAGHHPSQMNHPHSMPPGYPPHSAGPVSNHPAHQMPPGHMPNAPPPHSGLPPPNQMMPPSNYHPGKLADSIKQHHEQQMYGMRPPMHPSGKPISYQQSMQPPPNLYGPPHQSQMPHASSSAPHSHHMSMPPHSTPYSQQPPGHHPYHHQTGPPVSMHQPPPMLNSNSDPQHQPHHQQPPHYQMPPNDYHMRGAPGPNYSPYNYPQPPPNGYNSKYQTDSRLMNTAATNLPTNLPTPQQQQPPQQKQPQPQIPNDTSNLSTSQNGKFSSGLS